MAWGGGKPGSAPAAGGSRWGALSSGPFRLYWVAMFSRVFGLQFRFIGTGWLVASKDGLDMDPIWIGIVSVASAVPTIVLSVPSGILADRYDHRKILFWSQSLTAVSSFALALAVITGSVNIWMVIVWGIFTGALAALANPAYSAILPRLIEMRSMASAVALVSTVWNTMRVVGPALAGLLIAVIGIGQAFFVTAAGFALSTVLLQMVVLKPVAPRRPGPDGGMLEGIRHIVREPIFLATIGLSFFTSVFGGSYQNLLPIFADDILNVGPQGFGWMEAAAGIGGFLGTFAIIRVGTGGRAGLTMSVAAALFGICIAAFAYSRIFPLTLILLFAGGFVSSMYLNLGMTTLQLRVPDELRGRVMGVWSMTYFMAQLGGLPAGALAHWIGAPAAVATGALSVTAFALIVLLVSPALRRMSTMAAAEPAGASGGG
ncbi:MAG: MFS transporter [Dehalococcoidia bacterium]|nr:MAG: MFS transporter [Dehalococcoidia bacterium]